MGIKIVALEHVKAVEAASDHFKPFVQTVRATLEAATAGKDARGYPLDKTLERQDLEAFDNLMKAIYK